MSKKLNNFLIFLMFAVCFVLFIVYEVCSGGFWADGTLSYLMLSIVFIFVAFFINIILHEAGHLVFGLLSGYKFSSFRIGNIVLFKKDGKFVIKKFSIPGTGGQCLLSPPDYKDGKYPVVLYNLGGVIFNAAVGVLFLIPAFFPSVGNVFKGFSLIMSLFGFITAISNAMPVSVQIDTDGKNAFFLAKDKDAMRAMWIQLKVNALQYEGVRLKDMPEEWFSLPGEEEMKRNALTASLFYFRLCRLLDEKDFENALELSDTVDAVKDSLPGLYYYLVVSERMFLEMLSGDAPLTVCDFSDKKLKAFDGRMKKFLPVIRRKYTYASMVSHNAAAANTAERDFNKIIKSYPNEAEAETEKELFTMVKDFAESDLK